MKSKRRGNRGKLDSKANSGNYDLGGMGKRNGSANRIGKRCRENKRSRKKKKKERG